MTATVLPPDVVEALKPDYVAPLVAYLSHPNCDETDGVFEVGSGWIARVKLQRSHGIVFPSNEPFDSEDVSLNWKSIVDFNTNSANYPASAAESFSLFYERVLAGGDKVKRSKEACIGPVVYDYDNRDVAFYNLSIGADRNELRWVYEGHPEFEALPTFGINPAFGIAMATDFDTVLKDFSWV
jgi:multifunctional beta-oxidation protein